MGHKKLMWAGYKHIFIIIINFITLMVVISPVLIPPFLGFFGGIKTGGILTGGIMLNQHFVIV